MTADDLAQIAAEEMHSHGFEPVFPAEALREAQSSADVVALEARAPGETVVDLRERLWFSIDNDDTLDLDQLTWAEALPGGGVQLAVAVADVDVLVPRGSAVDAYAGVNTTSVYTAAGVFPMLPPRLSNDLTSLREGVDRRAVVVEMTIDAEGDVTHAEMRCALVRNHAKLAYDSVAAWLDGSGPSPAERVAHADAASLEAQLKLHDKVAGSLRHWRHRRGALNLATAQARPVFEQGKLVNLRTEQRNRAKDLIADLMIAANGATARFLARHGLPSLRRVLQRPRRWDRLVQLAELHGGTLPETPDALALDDFLTQRHAADPAGFEDLSLSVVKLIGSGSYAAMPADAAPAGHFGLAVNDYAHSTAPNRRFVDLVTQRMVKAMLAGQAAPYGFAELEAIARHCSLQEDSASSIERRVLKAAAAFLLHDRIGEQFDAVVTGVTPKGTFVRIAAPLVEGRVISRAESLDVGDSLKVRLLGVDVAQRFIDFEPVAMEPSSGGTLP